MRFYCTHFIVLYLARRINERMTMVRQDKTAALFFYPWGVYGCGRA